MPASCRLLSNKAPLYSDNILLTLIIVIVKLVRNNQTHESGYKAKCSFVVDFDMPA